MPRYHHSNSFLHASSRTGTLVEDTAPHELLLRYLHPASSIWPKYYLRAFDLSRRVYDTEPQLDRHTGPPYRMPSAGEQQEQRMVLSLSTEQVLRDIKHGVMVRRTRQGMMVRPYQGTRHGADRKSWKHIRWVE